MDWVLSAFPVVLLLMGFPIFIILLSASAVVLLFFMNIPLTAVHQVMFGSVDKFALMAVPFFLFAGELMGVGGMSKRIIDFVMSLIGWMRGCLPLTTVGANTIFGAVCGSSTAAVAAIGKLMYPTLREKYDDRMSSSVICCAGAIDIIIPPSISMILYGASAEQSVALLFVAGILPGIVMSIAMGGYVWLYARVKKIADERPFDPKEVWRATKSGIWALGTPGIILGGIYGGIFSPTEAAGVACVYAILVTLFIYRDINLKGIWGVAVNSMYLTAQVFIIVAGAGVFSWLLTVGGVPQRTVEILGHLATSQWEALLIINIFLLIVGCFIDPGSAILVLTPLLVPICKAFGIDLIHFGIIMTVNLAIGMFTPPFGLNIFVAQALFKTNLRDMYPGLVGFIIASCLALAIITYVPWLSLYLTHFV